MEPKRPGPVPRAPASDEETRPSQQRQQRSSSPADEATRVSRNSVPAAPADDRTALAPPRRPSPPPAPPALEETGSVPPPQALPLPKPKRERGAVPEAHGTTPTRTQRVLAGLQREWRYTAGCIGASLGLSVLAWWLYANDHPMLAAVAGLAILPVMFTAVFVRSAPCPRCQRPITIIGIEQCEHCREYIYVEGSELKLVGAGFIAEGHSFELNVPIPILPRVVFPKDGCCVCADRADREEVLDVQGTRILIPHCVQHNEGAQWQLGVVMEAVPTVTFKFRGFDYWRAVRQANWAHVRAGMWR